MLHREFDVPHRLLEQLPNLAACCCAEIRDVNAQTDPIRTAFAAHLDRDRLGMPRYRRIQPHTYVSGVHQVVRQIERSIGLDVYVFAVGT